MEKVLFHVLEKPPGCFVASLCKGLETGCWAAGIRLSALQGKVEKVEKGEGVVDWVHNEG